MKMAEFPTLKGSWP